MSFGARFGALVRRKREDQGLGTTELALEAFGDPAKKSRISEIENGKVKRPHAKTVADLSAALKLTPDEIEACRRPLDIPQVEGLPPELLENLAMRFGADNPDAGVAQQVAFLKEKAKDYREMSERLEAMGEAEGRIRNVMAAARAAIDDGDFDGADARLADAEEMQQTEHTLVQVAKQAEMRVERGQARLLTGDAAGAAEHFETAAGFFGPFDRDRQAGLARELGDRLYYHGLRYGGEGLPAFERVCRGILTIWTCETAPENWAMVQNDLAIALQEQGKRLDGEAGADKLGEAVVAYRAALEVRTREVQPVDWAMTQENLAVALMALAAAQPDVAGGICGRRWRLWRGRWRFLIRCI